MVTVLSARRVLQLGVSVGNQYMNQFRGEELVE
jgi:hypothetical protein